MPVTERTTVLDPVPADRPGWDNHAESRSGAGSRSGSGFASASVPRHLARGAVGFGSLIAAFALLPVFGPATLLLAPVGVVALRGCRCAGRSAWPRPSPAAGSAASARTASAN